MQWWAEVPGRIIHDFRQTAVRDMVRAGIAEQYAMAMTEHKTRSVFDRYLIVDPAGLKEAAAMLDRGSSAAVATNFDTPPSAQPG